MINNKGQFSVARKTIFWMIISIVIIFLVFGFALIYSSFNEKLTKVNPKVKTEIVLSRLIYNTDCLAYKDEHDLYQRGVIDLKKFNNETLEKCYSKDYDEINLRLNMMGLEIITPEYYHHDSYGEERTVLVYDGQKIVLKRLKIYVQEKI